MSPPGLCSVLISELNFMSWAHTWFNAARVCFHIPIFALYDRQLDEFVFRCCHQHEKRFASASAELQVTSSSLENKPKLLQLNTSAFCSCSFCPVQRLLLLVLCVLFYFFPTTRFLFHGQSSKMCTQHSPLQECGGVLYDECNIRLAWLMFARCGSDIGRTLRPRWLQQVLHQEGGMSSGSQEPLDVREKACKRCWNSIFLNLPERILVIWFVVFWSWLIFIFKWFLQIADKPSDKVVFLVQFLVKQFISLFIICSDLL